MRWPKDIYIEDIHRYLNRRQSNHKLFRIFYNRLGETGSFQPKSKPGTPKTITVDEEDNILIRVLENPGLSTGRLSAATGLSQSSICRLAYNLLSFHKICKPKNPDFLNKILFTDEATRRGVFNWRNNNLWDPRIHMLQKKDIFSMSLRRTFGKV
ncbi:hypothetical protein NQ318_009589 [Aromia moschata]|uniref:Uncharacterized protein n=1 Tax=Aromia moschata TaxID=1265417 RepID=A0AAV8Y564_9CUCU|nr:hypothetical protein NQ318_009589 [Aromia moschata]